MAADEDDEEEALYEQIERTFGTGTPDGGAEFEQPPEHADWQHVIVYYETPGGPPARRIFYVPCGEDDLMTQLEKDKFLLGFASPDEDSAMTFVNISRIIRVEEISAAPDRDMR